MVTDPRTYVVTGELTPDITGLYHFVGMFNARPSFELAGDGWFIWWSPPETWVISTIRGVPGANFWTRPFPDIEGLYPPDGGAIGGATVTEA